MKGTVKEVNHSEPRRRSKQELEKEHCTFLKVSHPPAFDRMGKEQFDRAIERHLLLTPRQFEVARLVALGFESKEIAALWGISEDGVKKPLTEVMRKANVDSRTKVAQWFVGL
jgi:DNA-binding NarL/FixJ family response regulator